jgi:hypothetical protein
LVRTQHCVTASAGQRRGDVEVRSYLRRRRRRRRRRIYSYSMIL